MKVDLSHYTEEKPHYFKRLVWTLVNKTIFRAFTGEPFRFFRNFLLVLFGAKIVDSRNTLVYSSCEIFAPWNLVLGRCCLGPSTIIYNKAPIHIGDNAVVSQGAYLCTASHDITKTNMPLITAPIIIEDSAWIASRAFVGMGVTIGQGAVVGATASVYRNVPPWTVVGGNPAKVIGKREIKND